MSGPHPGTQTSPWTWQAQDYQGNAISVSVTFNTNTLALTGASITRDPACVYTRIYLGTGSDGRPDDTPHVFAVPAGTTNYTAQQLSSGGLNTLSDVLALQITAGP